jgi:hypothetical protein
MYCPRCANPIMFAEYSSECEDDRRIAFCRVCGWQPGDPLPERDPHNCGDRYIWDQDEGEETCLW